MADRATESSLFVGRDVRTISNAIDTDFWTPAAEDPSGGPNGRVRVLFVALSIDEHYKGFRYFADACRLLASSTLMVDFEVTVVGRSQTSQSAQLGKPTTYLGRINSDEDLRRVYRYATVTVVPSTEEAFGKTAAESIACGTPVVCFSGTGVADVVEHGVTGFHARHGDASDLAGRIGAVLGNSEPEVMRSSARAAAVKSFSVEIAARQYVELYNDVIRDSLE
jgi:glycosyltransferase involved in cell wall biosynthesis